MKMKKVLMGLFVIATVAVNAQIETGQVFVGGSFGFGTSGSSNENIVGGTSTLTDGTSTFSFNILPQVGYMITDNFGAGLGMGYNFLKITTPDFFDNGANQYDQVDKYGTFVIMPFARYYKGIADKFFLFGEFSIPIGFGNYSSLMWNDNRTGTVDYDGIRKALYFGIDLSLGANYFITDNIALEANFGLFGMNYSSTKQTNTDNDGDGNIDKISGFNLDFDTNNIFNTGNISVGIKIFF